MERFLTSKSNLEHVPESYIQPPDCRPEIDVPLCKSMPIIDLGGESGYDDSSLAQKIIKASQEFGFFQLVNHGIPKKLMDDALQVGREFFQLPIEDKEKFCSEEKYSLKLSVGYANEDIHNWRDNIRHYCPPLHEHIQNWPDKPTNYRDVIGSYSVKVRELSMQLLDLISKGLGLESDYFSDELCNIQTLGINYYPPCPDPSLTLGAPKHSDLNMITVLLQDEIKGLQIFKDGEWFAIEPILNALVINIGNMLQDFIEISKKDRDLSITILLYLLNLSSRLLIKRSIYLATASNNPTLVMWENCDIHEIISNGKLKSIDHRVVTNKTDARVTIGSFIHPSLNSQIEPEKALIGGEFNSSNPLYKSFQYKDFVASYIDDAHARVSPIERYKLK